ncbi:hypothetical protein FRX31_024522 [Thalictrum thalictroides]|uniref:Uncharacterized protein n=1 Tax=Thalictrum thalictroides TaxID=46969 RepID=A0A7J6VMB1_THATH|nr:hypothetical protein FRX31_024522 [Thalictrum thalictroides]
MNKITSQGYQASKELLKLQSTLSNRRSVNFPSDFPGSVEDVNSSSSITPSCRRRCLVHEIGNVNRLNYGKEMIRSSDEVYNHNDIVADDGQTNASTEESVNYNKSIDKKTCKTADATSAQAMWFRSQSACNRPSDNIFGVSYDYLEKAIEKIAENKTLDHQDLAVVPPNYGGEEVH